MSLRNPQRLLALLLVPACIGLAACGGGGGGDEEPDTQVVVPTQTAVTESTATADDGALPTIPGYLTSADNEKVKLIVEDGRTRTFWVASEDFEGIGIPHLASHAGLTELGFLVTYERRNGRSWIKRAEEIPPPFAFPSTADGQ